MQQWQKNLWALSVGVFIANLSFTMVMPFFPAFLLELSVKVNIPLWTGALISVSFLASGLMAPVWGSLADRHGKRIMLARSGFGMVIVLIAMGLVTNHWQLLICRVLNGLFAGFIPASIMLVASNTPDDNMGYALGMLNTFIATGGIMGPFFGGAMVEYIGIRPTIFASAGILMVATLLAVFATGEKIIKQAVRTTIREDLQFVSKNGPLKVYFFCMVTLQMVTFMFMGSLPLRIAELTATNTQLATGIIFSLTGLALAIGSPLVSRITNTNYMATLFGGLLFSGILCLVQGLTGSVVVLGITRFIFGFSIAAVSVSGNVLIARSAGEEVRGRIFGVLNACTAFGAVISPLLGGFLGEVMGITSSFFGCAVLFFLAAYVLRRYSSRAVGYIKMEHI